MKLEAVALLQAGSPWSLGRHSGLLKKLTPARTLLQLENGPRVPGATPPRPPSAAPLPTFVFITSRPWEYRARRNHFFFFAHSRIYQRWLTNVC